MFYFSEKRKKGYYYVTTTYAIPEANEFMKFGAFVEARKGMRTPKTCFVCHHKFTADESIYLAPVQGDKNRIVCARCAKMINRLKK